MATNLKLTSDQSAWQLNVDQKQPYVLQTSEKYMDKNIKVVPKVGTLSVNNTPGVTYTEREDLVIPSEGFLYINSGYHDDTKISLATLVPDFEDLTHAAAAPHIMAGYMAYDKDGNLLTGTLETIQLSDTYYTTSASGAVAASAISPGNLATTHYIKAGSVSVNGGDLVDPQITYSNDISKINITSGATSDNITLTEETSVPSGKFYFTVRANAPDVSGTVKTSVSARTQSFTKGWIESANLTSSLQEKTANINVTGDTKTKYYSVNKANVQDPRVGSITTTVSDIQPTANLAISTTTGDKSADIVSSDVKFVSAKPSSGFFIGIKGGSDANTAAGTVSTSIGDTTVTVSEGYVSEETQKTVTGHQEEDKNINLKASSVTKWLQLPTSTCTINGGTPVMKEGGNGVASVSATPSAGLNQKALTFQQNQPASGNYWTVTADASTPVVQVSAITYKHTEGYVKNMSSAAQKTGVQTFNATVDPTTYYIPQAGYNSGFGTTTNTVNVEGTTATKTIPTTYEVKVNGAGYDYNGHVIKTIPVYQGEYSA